MMIAKMMETLKTAGIAKEWHKGDMHRLYIDLAKAADLYYDNNEGFEHGRLNINRRERDNGKLWVELESGEICTKGIYMDSQVISQIMELVAFLTPAEVEETEETTAEETTTEETTTEEPRVWYAVQLDSEDTDHGTGSFDREEAICMARKYRASGYPEAYIAMIDTKDDYCIDELHDL